MTKEELELISKEQLVELLELAVKGQMLSIENMAQLAALASKAQDEKKTLEAELIVLKNNPAQLAIRVAINEILHLIGVVPYGQDHADDGPNLLEDLGNIQRYIKDLEFIVDGVREQEAALATPKDES